MIRKQIKILGIGLVAAMALSALDASVASAQEEQGVLTTEFGNDVILTGTDIGTEKNRLTAFGALVECPGSTYTGHKLEATPHELIPPEATQMTITPHFNEAENNCQMSTPFGPRPATIDMTGCDYELSVGKTTPAENDDGTYGVTVDIECPEEKHIDLTAFEDAEHSETICKWTVTEQTSLTGLHLTNGWKEDPRVSGTIKNLHVDREGLCTLDGKGTTTTEGELDARITLEAHNVDDEPEGITFSDERC